MFYRGNLQQFDRSGARAKARKPPRCSLSITSLSILLRFRAVAVIIGFHGMERATLAAEPTIPFTIYGSAGGGAGAQRAPGGGDSVCGGAFASWPAQVNCPDVRKAWGRSAELAAICQRQPLGRKGAL